MHKAPSGESIRKSMEIINKVGHGIMLYLRLDGRQGPLSNKVKIIIHQKAKTMIFQKKSV